MKKFLLFSCFVMLGVAGCSDGGGGSTGSVMDSKIEVSMSNFESIQHIDFGAVDSGQTVERQITIRNIGNNTIEVLNLNVSDNSSFINFEVTDNCQNGLQPYQSCTATITFDPKYIVGEATVDARLEIWSHFLYTVRIPLVGQATNKVHITVDKTFVRTGSVWINGSSGGGFVKIKNHSSILPVHFNVGTLPNYFSQTNDCYSMISRNSECTITIRFVPTSVGTHTGTFSIYGDSINTKEITVEGEGV